MSNKPSHGTFEPYDMCKMRPEMGGFCPYTYDACFNKHDFCRVLESTREYLDKHPEEIK
jgi:hypothetical protein